VRIIDSIVLHTAGAYNPKTGKVVHQSMEDVRRYHIESNGWTDIGYHAFVDKDGHLTYGRSVDQAGAHARGFNAHSLGLCVSGHGDYEEWSPAQLKAVIAQCVDWCHAYGIKPAMVLGHNETDEHGGPPVYKSCPGIWVNMVAIREAVTSRMIPAFRRTTLNGDGFDNAKPVDASGLAKAPVVDTSGFITQANPTIRTVRVDPDVEALRSLVAALETNQFGFANATTDTTVRRVDPDVEALRSLIAALEANQRALVKRIEDLEQRKP
jgi:N-acetylmuramoyl-L-alanine amidase